MTKHVGFYYRVEWGNPYTSPPENKPRIIAEYFESIEQRSARMQQGEPAFPKWLSDLHQIGDGYAICGSAICKPSTPLPREKLASIRKKRLVRRLTKKYPLLFEQFMKSELERKPDYYSGITDSDIEAARDDAIRQQEELYQRYLNAISEEP